MRPLQFYGEESAAEGNSASQWHKSVLLLAYADDIDIIGCTIRDVTTAFSANGKRAFAKMGLAVNEGKTKYMLSTSGDVPRMEYQITAKSAARDFMVK